MEVTVEFQRGMSEAVVRRGQIRAGLAAMLQPAWTAPPTTSPGGKPVIARPGLTPRSPPMVLGPVFVTVEPLTTSFP